MHRYIHHNTTDSIKSLVDVYTFRTEELVISLSEIEILIPDFVNEQLPIPLPGVGIYAGDEIKPRLMLSNRDMFYRKTAVGMVPVAPHELTNLTNIYLRSHLIENLEGLKLIGVEYFFGPNVRLKMSVKAQRKLLATRVIGLFLQLEDLHALSVELNIPNLESLYPPADVEAWRNFVSAQQQLQRPKTNASFYHTKPPSYWEKMEAFLPGENGFYYKLLDHLGRNMKGLFRDISLFLNDFRDCLYSIELNGEKLSIVRGIDHKYIPYYEQKFKHVEEE